MSSTVRKPGDRGRAGSAILGVVSAQCHVCSLPKSIQDDLARQRGVDGSSFDSLAEDFNNLLPERIQDDVLPADTPLLSGQTLRNHFDRHATLTVDTLYPHVKDRQIDMLRDVLNKRAAMFQRMYGLVDQVMAVIEKKYEEWRRLLDSEEHLRRDYYQDAVQVYEEAKRKYASDVEAALLRGETPPKPPPAAQTLAPVPSVSGIDKEEERLLRLLEAVRKQVADASKIISSEEGYISYVNLEVEEMLKALTQDSIDAMREFETALRPMVPVDKHEAVRDTIRTYLHRVHANQKDRYKVLFRNLQKFTKDMRSGGK